MTTIRVRLYRSHDYDLMVLAKTGAISIATVAKKALEACYLGEDYTVKIKDEIKPIPKSNNSLLTIVRVDDEDCPGIEHWFNGFEYGARNNMIKCLIRKAIKNVPMWAYRTDGWISAEQEAKEVQALMENVKEAQKAQEVIVKKTPASKEKKSNKTAQPIEETSHVAESQKTKVVAKPNASPLVKKKEEQTVVEKNNLTKTLKAESKEMYYRAEEIAESDDDDDFDAFAAFNALQT